MMRALILGVAVVAMATSSVAVAQTRTWTNGSANLLWGDAGNWDTGIPGAGETASFGATGVGTIDLGNATRTITNLTATTAGYTFANGTLDVSGISPTNAGLTTISAQVTDQAGNGLTLNQNSSDSTGLTISGPLVIGSASATALRVAGTTGRNGTFTLGSTTLANSVTGGVTLDASLNSGTTFQGNWTIGGDLRLVRGTSQAASGAALNGTISIGGNLVNAMNAANAGAVITIGSISSVSVTGDLRVMSAANNTNATGITINKALTTLGGNVQVYHGTLNLNVTNPIPSTTQAILLGDPTNTSPTLASTISINTNAITLNNPVTVQSGNDAQAILTSGASGTNSANKVTYAGTITLNKNLFVDPSNTANAIIDLSGKVTGTGGLTINNAGRAGTVWLSNASNDYSGGTTVLRTLLQVNAAGALGGSGRNVTVANLATVTLGYAPAGSLQADLLGRIVSTSTGTAALNGNVSATSGEDLDFSSAGNNFTGLSLGAVGAVSYTGTLTPNGSTYRVGGGGGTLTFNPAVHDASKSLLLFGSGTGGTVDLAGASRTFDRITFSNGTTQNGSLTGTSYVADNAAAATVSASLTANGTAGLTKYGTAQLTLSGLNTYTGATTVAGGTLALQFNATNAAGVVSSGSALTLGSGTLSLLGGSTAIANTQAFTSGTTLGGMATVSLAKNTATTVTLDLGTITRGNGSYLNVTTPAGTVVRASHPLDSTGTLLGTWASVGTGTSLSYAASTSATDGTISAYTGATTATAGSLANVTSNSTNYQYAAAATLAANQTAHTLRYTGAATTTALGTNSLTLNGLMNAGSGKLTISGTAGSPGLVTGADGMLNIVTNTQSIDITSVISGAGGLTFGGPSAGQLSLTGLNTYTGKTTIVSGTLSLTGNQALRNAGVGSGLGAPTGADATIDLHNGVIVQVGGISPTRQSQSTDRTINLAGAGPGTVTLRFTDNDNIFTLGAVTATGAGAKTLAISTGFGGSGDREEVTFNGSIGNGADGSPLSLLVTFRSTSLSPNVVNLVGGGTFTGPISLTRPISDAQAYFVIGGRLTAANSPVSTPGTGQLNGGDYAGNISLDTGTILYYNSNSNQTLSGVISGLGSVHKAAGGVLTPSGTNTYTGVTTLTGGTLSVAALGNGGVAGNLGAATNAAANIVFNGGTLRYTGSGETSDRAFTINAGTTATIEVTSGALSLAGATGAATNGSLSKAGVGTLTLTGASTYTGATSINAGTLTLGSAQNGTTSGPLGANGTINFGGGTLQYSANTAIAVTDYSPRFATGSGVPVRVDTNGRDVTFATALGSVGGTLAKFGAGTLTLGTVNTYSGSTTIVGGTLTLEANGTIASSPSIVLASGATLDVTSKFGTGLALAVNQELKGDGTAYGNFTLGNGSILTPGVTGAGALTFDGNLTLAAGSVFNFELGPDSGPGSTYDQIRLFSRFGGGMLDVGAGLINFSNFNFTPLAGFGPGTYVLFDGGFTTTFAGTFGSSLNGTIEGLDATLGQSGSNVLLTVTSAVPEPGQLTLVAVAIVVAAGACRRSRRR